MNAFALIADRVWDGVADGPLHGHAVIVEGRRIAAVPAVEKLPAGLRRIELAGCTLMPGLMDAHVHYCTPMGPAFLAAGVTSVRDVGNDLEWILATRQRHADDPTLGPAIVCCGQLHNARPHWPRMGSLNADEAALRQSIRHHAARGVDQIKLYAALALDMFTAGVDEAHRHGKRVAAHLGMVDGAAACRAGVDCIEHLDRCTVAWGPATREQDDAFIDLLLERGVAIDPTFVVWDRLGRILDHAFLHDARRRFVHPCHLDVWKRYLSRFGDPDGRLRFQAAMPHLKRFMRRAHERGVTVAVGTDTPFPHLVPGFSVHDELSMFVDAGLAPIDALRAATSVNARVLGVADKAGRIAPGFDADLLAVRGDPLACIDDIGSVERVVRAGVVVDANDLAARMHAEAQRNNEDPVTLDLLDYIHGRQ